MSVSTVLIFVWWTWDVLFWGDRLTAGFADVLRRSPFFWKGHSQAQSSLQFSGRWRWRFRTWWKKIDFSGLVTWIKGIIVILCVRRIPAVEGAYVLWRRRYWDGSDSSGDCGLLLSSFASAVLFAINIVAKILKRLGGRFKSFRLGESIGSCRPKLYGIVGSLESSLIVKI